VTTFSVVSGILLFFFLRHGKSHPPSQPRPLPAKTQISAYAGSASCRECHEKIYHLWKNSHHALAERELNPAIDRIAFDPPRTFRHGTQTSQARVADGRFEVVTLGGEGKVKPYRVERVFGVEPLRQFLVKADDGRYQVTEIAFDPASREWFNVYGNEDRQPGEWGHWSGRGMTWNSMCAACHNTHVRKNYDEDTDTYRTTWAEMGVGCEACHGAMAAHVKWQKEHPPAQPPPNPSLLRRGKSRQTPLLDKEGLEEVRLKDPTILRLTKKQIPQMCGSCHSRRGELTGEFRPGELYLDHYAPAIPDGTDIYYPDGQVRDEDFEYVSFLGSRMFSMGVLCKDCHDVHSGKTRAKGNDLCLRCHKGKIEPASHSHHPLGKGGSLCVDCHMPITVYMARHPRRDHGFTIPDPLLTKERGVPNACNRCHTDRSVDWAIQWTQRWYPRLPRRHTAQRARWIAAARAGEESAMIPLTQMARQEKIALWRAVAVGLLERWAREAKALPVLLESTRDPDALVRGTAARALESLVGQEHPEVNDALRRLLKDPVRSVRVAAAWALRAELELNSRAGKDLERYLKHNADQPTGALQVGTFYLDRGQTETALTYFRRAVSWDKHSAALRSPLAIALSTLGKTDEAVAELKTACRLAPRDAGVHYNLGLALAEINKMNEAAAALEKVVRLDPRFARAWYNLGLARDALGKPDAALAALARAEALDSRSPDIPYARATILQRLGRVSEARAAVHRTLALNPNHAEAVRLLRALDNR
jgi:predicted CXXCH cytochrome family protein